MLSRGEARRVYDRIGWLQDTQFFYEDRATEQLCRHGDFPSAVAVFEFGFGTGRFALRLLTEFLSPTATYRGVDISSGMLQLARRRLSRYSTRAELVLGEGGPPTEEPADSCDRFVSNYVFDLLSEEDIRSVLREARRMLRSGGLLCLTGLSTGTGPLSRLASDTWSRVQAHRPSLVGGCRPIDLLPFVPESEWRLRFHKKVVAFAITSEVLVAERR